MSNIRLGLIPDNEGDKWFAFFDDDQVFLHHSTSGRGIFQASFKPVAGGGFVMRKATVTGDVTHYKRKADELETATLERLISVVLAGRRTPQTQHQIPDDVRDRIHPVSYLRKREGSAVRVVGRSLHVFDSNHRVIDEVDLAGFGEMHYSQMHMLTNWNCNYFAGSIGRSSPLAFSVLRFALFGKSLIANDWFQQGGLALARASYTYIGD